MEATKTPTIATWCAHDALVSLAELKPNPRNPNKHPKGQIHLLAKIIREQGWRNPIVVSTRSGLITRGHGRLEAARLLKAESVPVDFQDYSSEEEELADAIADNRIAELAEIDEPMLRQLIEQLDQSDFDIELAGFDDKAIADLMAATAPENDADAEPQIDKAEELAAKWRTERDQIWELGAHRLMCGDSTQVADVSALITGETVQLLITDPPYCSGGFQEAGRSAGSVGTDAVHKQVANDRLSSRGYAALLKSAFGLIPMEFAYVFTDWRMWVNLFDVMESSGFGVRSMIVWDKGTPGMGRGWRSQHELVMWGAKSTPPFDKHASGNGNVISCKRTGNPLHTTQKPVEVMVKLLEAVPFAPIAYDPFCGSATTLIACEQLGRKCRAMEIDPGYVAVAIQRWVDATGGVPRLLNGDTKPAACSSRQSNGNKSGSARSQTSSPGSTTENQSPRASKRSSTATKKHSTAAASASISSPNSPAKIAAQLSNA